MSFRWVTDLERSAAKHLGRGGGEGGKPKSMMHKPHYYDLERTYILKILIKHLFWRDLCYTMLISTHKSRFYKLKFILSKNKLLSAIFQFDNFPENVSLSDGNGNSQKVKSLANEKCEKAQQPFPVSERCV